MNVEKILMELRQERDQIDHAILRLESIAQRSKRPGGRALDWMTKNAEGGPSIPQRAAKTK